MLLQPSRARADLHAADDVRGVERAVLAGLDRHVGQEVAPPGRARGQAGELHRRIGEIAAEPRGQFARHAEVAEGVRPVGRDFDVKHYVAGRQHVVDGGPQRGAPGEDQQAGMGAAEAELVRGAHHAVGQLAADPGLLDLEVAGQHGARQRHRHAVAHPVIWRAAHDGLHAPGRTNVDGADGELVGVGMRLAGEHFADHDERQRRQAGPDHLLDLETEKRDGVGDFVDGRVEGDVGLEPMEREFHGRRQELGVRSENGRSIGFENFGDLVQLRTHRSRIGVSEIMGQNEIVLALFERTLSDVEVPNLVGRTSLLESLGDIRGDRDRRAPELRTQTIDFRSRECFSGFVDGQHERMRLLPYDQISEALGGRTVHGGF